MIFIPSESQEAIALIQWANMHPICKNYLFHIPNEGKRSYASGIRLKREGLKRGVSDYFLAYPSHNKHGLWIELKRRKKSKVTIFQDEFIEKMNLIGYEAKVGYGWEHAVNIIINYLK